MLVVLARAFGGPGWLFIGLMAGAALLVWAGFSTIPARLRNTAFVLFGLTILLLPVARAPLEAIQRGVFISGQLLALIASVLLLAHCARSSRHIQRVGAALRGQPLSRRYLSFSITGQLFSGMLGMAGAHIMLVMAAPAQEKADPTRVESVVGVTRAFSVAGFWSPVFGNMVILLALYPTLDWIDIFPVGVVLAQMGVVVGYLLHRREARRASSGTPGDAEGRHGVADLLVDGLPLLIAMLAFMGVILTASHLIGIVVPATIILLGPLFALLIHLALAAPGRRLVQALSNLRDSVLQYPRLASEALLFMAAGCAGSIMADAFPPSWAQAIGAVLGGHPFPAIAFLMISIMAASLAGIHAVLSAVFLASTITPQVLGLPPLTHMAAILVGWGLAAVVAPFSVLSLTAARYAGTSIYDISFGRNWLFTLMTTLLACAALSIITNML